MKFLALTLLLGMLPALAEPPATAGSVLVPYSGESIPGVDTSTLIGKVMTGYQGWFNTPGDGADLGWTHWARDGSKLFAPGNVTVDLWPDMSEASPSERFETGFKHADGSTAVVFSSHHRRYLSSAISNGCRTTGLMALSSSVSLTACLANEATIKTSSSHTLAREPTAMGELMRLCMTFPVCAKMR